MSARKRPIDADAAGDACALCGDKEPLLLTTVAGANGQTRQLAVCGACFQDLRSDVSDDA